MTKAYMLIVFIHMGITNGIQPLLGYCYGANNKKRFINDTEVIGYGAQMLIATSLAGPILGLLFLSINSMQAMDCPVPATLLSICRQGLFFIPLLYILKAGFGLQGINYTQTISDYLAIVISLLLLRRSLRKFKGDPS